MELVKITTMGRNVIMTLVIAAYQYLSMIKIAAFANMTQVQRVHLYANEYRFFDDEANTEECWYDKDDCCIFGLLLLMLSI